MSSRHHSILGSTVFQRVLWSSGVFILLALCVLWAVAGAVVWQSDRTQAVRIQNTLSWIEGLYYSDDPDRVYDVIRDDEDLIWSEELIFVIQENRNQLIVWRDSNYEPRAGFPGLHGEEGWSRSQIEHPIIDQEVRGFRVNLKGGDLLTVAEFVPALRTDALFFAKLGSIALLLIALPLSVMTGYLLARKVFGRIEEISAATEAVGAGQMDFRAPVSGRHDEFDRLGLGINAMLERVETLNQNIEAVSVGVAHDLRTPLTNIGGRLELIRRDIDKPDDLEVHVERAEQHLGQLLRIFDALLRLGEVEAGKRKAAFEKLNLSELMNHMADAFSPVFSDADKTLAILVEPDVHIHGDKELIEQALANLLENGLEHTRDGAKLTLSLRKTRDGAEMRIADNGPGISPVDREKIFDRFYRGDKSRGSNGSGLGLSLVKAIADLHGAAIVLDDKANETDISITFVDSQ